MLRWFFIISVVGEGNGGEWVEMEEVVLIPLVILSFEMEMGGNGGDGSGFVVQQQLDEMVMGEDRGDG